MVPHDLKSGYTRIANTLLECIYLSDLSGFELRALLWVVRNSYGYNRKFTRAMSVRKMSEEIKASRNATHIAMRNLLSFGIIKKTENGELFLSKNALPKCPQFGTGVPNSGQGRCPELGTLVSPTRDSSVPNSGHSECNIKKDNLKDNLKDMGSTRAPFCPPSLAEITDYCQTRKNSVNPDLFLAHYESNGWRVGRNPMRNWQAAVRYWEKNGINAPAKAKTAKGCAPVLGKYDGLGEKV